MLTTKQQNELISESALECKTKAIQYNDSDVNGSYYQGRLSGLITYSAFTGNEKLNLALVSIQNDMYEELRKISEAAK